jgi:hypothetical protein
MSPLTSLAEQFVWVLMLALPVACISWTVTHEEVLREPREWMSARSERARNIFVRKFFYMPTCEYCFSHWVTILVLIMTHFTLLYDDWRGYIIAGFAIVWIANFYISLFARLRLDIKHERKEIEAIEEGDPLATERLVEKKQIPSAGAPTKRRLKSKD